LISVVGLSKAVLSILFGRLLAAWKCGLMHACPADKTKYASLIVEHMHGQAFRTSLLLVDYSFDETFG
jgi:hypothetical protein